MMSSRYSQGFIWTHNLYKADFLDKVVLVLFHTEVCQYRGSSLYYFQLYLSHCWFLLCCKVSGLLLLNEDSLSLLFVKLSTRQRLSKRRRQVQKVYLQGDCGSNQEMKGSNNAVVDSRSDSGLEISSVEPVHVNYCLSYVICSQ